ncbi:MAG: hypothetical protein KDI10_15770 [Halioglobus sp.]|nr:hypothetical protein [Halioglobus sp.]
MLTQVTAAISEHTAPLASDTQRVLAIGGILLIASGMLFGDIFAMFALHPNNARIGAAMYTAAGLIPTGDVDGILAQFMAIGGFLEFRGTKVDTHSHIIHMGYIALLLAMLQPWVALSPRVRHRTAWLFILCAALMPPAIFAIHYVGLAYSPLQDIGWASIFADLFGALLALATVINLYGLWRHVGGRGDGGGTPTYINAVGSGAGRAASRILLVGGLLLLVSGFLYGAGLALYHQFNSAPTEVDILKSIVTAAAAGDRAALDAAFGAFGNFQMLRAINVASHTHINEMGILLLLVSFVQAFVQYPEATRNRWAKLAVVGAFGLPAGILLEIPYGIVGSVIADSAGFLVIVSLMAMLFGLLRYTGASDAGTGGVA